jgi:hypothetical protein
VGFENRSGTEHLDRGVRSHSEDEFIHLGCPRTWVGDARGPALTMLRTDPLIRRRFVSPIE